MQHIPMETYEQAHADFNWQIPDNFNFGIDVVDRWAEDPQKLALVSVDASGSENQLTFADKATGCC